MGIVSDVMDVAGFGYGVYQDQRNYQAQQRQQAFQNDFSLNQMQYRAKDLEKAGLHPVLAVGGSGSSPTSASSLHSNNLDTGSIAHNALMDAQREESKARADLVRAEAQKVRSETEHIPKRYELDLYKLHNVDAPMTAMAEDRLEMDKTMHGIARQFKNFEYQLLQLGVKGEKQRQTMVAIDMAIKQIERDYMKEHGSKMPTADVLSETIRRHLGEFWHDYRLANIIADGSVETVTKILDYRLRARKQKNFDRMMY